MAATIAIIYRLASYIAICSYHPSLQLNVSNMTMLSPWSNSPQYFCLLISTKAVPSSKIGGTKNHITLDSPHYNLHAIMPVQLLEAIHQQGSLNRLKSLHSKSFTRLCMIITSCRQITQVSLQQTATLTIVRGHIIHTKRRHSLGGKHNKMIKIQALFSLLFQCSIILGEC